jgi:hypothetical protein
VLANQPYYYKALLTRKRPRANCLPPQPRGLFSTLLAPTHQEQSKSTRSQPRVASRVTSRHASLSLRGSATPTASTRSTTPSRRASKSGLKRGLLQKGFTPSPLFVLPWTKNTCQLCCRCGQGGWGCSFFRVCHTQATWHRRRATPVDPTEEDVRKEDKGVRDRPTERFPPETGTSQIEWGASYGRGFCSLTAATSTKPHTASDATATKPRSQFPNCVDVAQYDLKGTDTTPPYSVVA